jgi:8-oxo-dGTP pyrophosphatase MutT (NUDIX family)
MKLEIMPSSSSNIEVDEYDDGQCDDRPHRLPRVDFDRTMIVGNTNWMRLETLSYLVEDVSAEDDDVGDSGKGGVGGGDMTKGGDGRMRRNTSYRKWDRVVRTTKVSEDSIDAVLILATLRGGVRGGVVGGDDDDDDGDDDLLVCVRQYRPAVDMDVLELPAGLIDTNEDARAAAIRELREETGYVGTPVSSSSSTGTGFGDTILGTYLSPGLTNENACLVRLDVDLNDEENRRVYDAHVAGNDNNNIDDDDGGISMNNNDDIINHMMETSERERMMTTVLLPTTNILDSIHAYLIKEEDKGVGGDVRNKCGIFTGLYHLAVGMHMGNAMMRNRTMKSTGTTNERKKVDDGEEGGGSSSIVISYDEARSSSASSSSGVCD